MNTLIYSRVSSQGQDNQRQIQNLKFLAEERNWKVRRIFQEKISGTTKLHTRPVFNSMLNYLESNTVDLILVSEVSRIGRRVSDILNSVDKLHEKGIGLYIQQFNIITFRDGKEDPVAKMLLQMLSIGAEMENNLRRDRQLEGIQLAKLKNKYAGRKKGALADPSELLSKYHDVVDLILKSDLSLRRIATISGRSINTVRKVRSLIDI